MIDGHPVPAVAAAFAAGETRSCSLVKRCVKEGDRLATTVALLHATKVPVRVDDDMIVNGGHADDWGGGPVQALMQPRLATSAVMMAPAARRPIGVGDLGLVGPMNRLGAGPAEPGA